MEAGPGQEQSYLTNSGACKEGSGREIAGTQGLLLFVKSSYQTCYSLALDMVQTQTTFLNRAVQHINNKSSNKTCIAPLHIILTQPIKY